MGDMIYRPLIEDMKWSYSRASSFSMCPLKWKLKYIDKETEGETFMSNFGSLMHEIIDMYYSGSLKKEEMLMYFLESYKNRVLGRRPKPEMVDDYINSAVEYLTNFEELPYECIETEKFVQFDLDGIRFVGVIDYIGKTEDGGIVLIDHKSRKLKPRSNRKKPTKNDMDLDEMQRQLYVYSEWVLQEYEKYPSKIGFNCFRNGQLIVEDFDEEKFKSAKQWVKETVNKIMDEENYDGDSDWFKCTYLCGYSGICEEYEDMMDELM